MSLDDHDDEPQEESALGSGPGGFDLHDLHVEDLRTRVMFSVPEGHPWFEGHFPGTPILPAVAQVNLVQSLHRMGDRTFIVGVHSLRLTAPIRPGDRLELTLGRPDEDGRGRIGLRTLTPGDEPEGGERRSDGVVQWKVGEPEAVPWEVAPYREGDAGVHPELLDRLPHTGPALLAREVLEVGDDHLVCRGRVPRDNASTGRWASTDRWPPLQSRALESPGPAAPEGHAGTWMALELAAQAAGLLEAATQRRDGEAGGNEGPPRVGYLVRVRDALFAHPFLPAEAPLRVRVRRTGGSGPLTLYDFVVELERLGSEPLVELTRGSLGTFVPPPEEEVREAEAGGQ